MTDRSIDDVVTASLTPSMEVPGSFEPALLLSTENVGSIQNCLGVAIIQPGEPTSAEIVHTTSEVMYVSRGRGILQCGEEEHPFKEGDALYIPAGKPHTLTNTGEEPLVSVYSFPLPFRPPTVPATDL